MNITLRPNEVNIGATGSGERREGGYTYLGRMWSGEDVYDRPYSHMHGDITELVASALDVTDSEDRDFFVTTMPFDQAIGYSNRVETSEDDEVFYAIREGRQTYSRFVLNRQPEESSDLTYILKKMQSGDYVMITAWIGTQAEHEPGDKHADPVKSKEFWSKQALIFDPKSPEAIDMNSVRLDCPWS